MLPALACSLLSDHLVVLNHRLSLCVTHSLLQPQVVLLCSCIHCSLLIGCTVCLSPQVRFVRNVTSWGAMKPGFYHGHVAYLDFSK